MWLVIIAVALWVVGYWLIAWVMCHREFENFQKFISENSDRRMVGCEFRGWGIVIAEISMDNGKSFAFRNMGAFLKASSLNI